MKIPFYEPWVTAADEARVITCLRSGWLTTGPLCAELEEALRIQTTAPYAITFSSCTAALHCALAFRLAPGDEVIVPTYTFAATATAVVHAGGRPVLCDVSPRDLNVGVEEIARRRTPRTRGVIAVDFAGKPCSVEALRAYCTDKGLFLIIDAAHSLGGSIHGAPVGGHGIDTVFSFYANKNVTTGEGGALVTTNGALDTFARRFRLHGMNVDAWKRFGGDWRPYDIEEVGWKYNLPDVLAALGLGQLRRLTVIVDARTRCSELYEDAIQEIPELFTLDAEVLLGRSARHLFVVRTVRRDALMAFLRERGIATAVHYVPLHQLSAFARDPVDFPVATLVAKEALSLPIFPTLTSDQMGYIVEALHDFFAAHP